jgi:glycosyltransferase involved in cell wall biosynthesis
MSASDPIETVTIIVPTLDEERNLPGCLETVCGYFRHVMVVDSLSTDATVALARARGCTVREHRFEGYSAQYNWALAHLPLETDWVFFLCADERMTPSLRGEIAAVTRDGATPHVGFQVPQRYVFMGRMLEHGGWAPSYQLRLFRRSAGRFEDRAVHEHPVLRGSVGFLTSHYVHHDLRDLTHFVAKHNRYSSLEAEEIVRALRGDGEGRLLDRGRLFGNHLERRRWIKLHVWPRLPGRALIRFVYQYLVRGGFRDGRAGLRFALLHAFFEVLASAKVAERLERPDDGAEP